VSAGLVVWPKVIDKHLLEELPFMATEAILMHAVRAGGDRQALHERIRQHSIAAAENVKRGQSNDLIERIVEDKSFALSLHDVQEAYEPKQHIGRAPQQVDAFLREHVQPILKRYDVLDEAPELKS
jgi:adenylosuccinate lyase